MALLLNGLEQGDLGPLALELGEVFLLLLALPLLLLLQEELLVKLVLVRVLAVDGDRRGIAGRRVLLVERAGKLGEQGLLASGDRVGRRGIGRGVGRVRRAEGRVRRVRQAEAVGQRGGAGNVVVGDVDKRHRRRV